MAAYSSNLGLAVYTECTDCPKGYYCLKGSPVPLNCSAGRYGDATNLMDYEYAMSQTHAGIT